MIEIKVKDMTMSLEEARELYDELHKVFGEKQAPYHDPLKPIGPGLIPLVGPKIYPMPPYDIEPLEWPRVGDFPEPLKVFYDGKTEITS